MIAEVKNQFFWFKMRTTTRLKKRHGHLIFSFITLSNFLWCFPPLEKKKKSPGVGGFFAAIEDSKTLISSVNDAIDDCLKRRLYCAKIKVFVHVGEWLRKLAAAALTHIVLNNVNLF